MDEVYGGEVFEVDEVYEVGEVDGVHKVDGETLRLVQWIR